MPIVEVLTERLIHREIDMDQFMYALFMDSFEQADIRFLEDGRKEFDKEKIEPIYDYEDIDQLFLGLAYFEINKFEFRIALSEIYVDSIQKLLDHYKFGKLYEDCVAISKNLKIEEGADGTHLDDYRIGQQNSNDVLLHLTSIYENVLGVKDEQEDVFGLNQAVMDSIIQHYKINQLEKSV